MADMRLLAFVYVALTIGAFEPVRWKLSTTGNQFQAANVVETLTVSFSIRTALHCATHCHRHTLCRAFDFDRDTHRCRLFEGSMDTGALLSVSSSMVVGWIELDPSFYSMYNASNDMCVDSRFLDSNAVSGLCQCPSHTFWNGSICANQRYTGQACANNEWCRTDLNLTCLSSTCVANANALSTLPSSASTAPATTSIVPSTVSTASSIISTAPLTTMAGTSQPSITTASPECIPQANAGGTLLYILDPTSSNYPNYTCYAYTWVATGASATLSFFFRHDPGGWMVDDISVYHGSTQLIINGGFETGDLSGWNRTGVCSLNVGQAYPGSAYAKSGNWYYYDLCAGAGNGDTLSQTFATVLGDTYDIKFWLTNYACCAPTEIANITLIS